MPDEPPLARGPDDPTVQESASRSRPETAQTIGLYHLQEKVGEGGMGEVWRAEQTEPVRRQVAIKIVKRGLDTKQVIARFEVEQHALALMDHPCIAKIFDAGETPRGRPYFAMEYVPGVPITAHCDSHRLSLVDRIALFQQVCEGVQHAHQKAVIHRDLKPSNILVAIREGKPVPKIIDFGVAKATAQRLTEKTLFTEMGVLIGTPEYMSPEQADLTAQDVDTRTDVYSLGVVLYELLTGALPFDPKELRSAGFEGIRRLIREREPPKPSTRASSLGDRGTAVALARRVEPTRLAGQLRGDLDRIVMKALEKDRGRRYGSPGELSADIRRYSRNEPVTAGPPSSAYRMRKFVARHRVVVAVCAAAFLLIAGVAIRERVQASRIAHERDRANREAEIAGQVSGFLQDIFRVSDPSEALGNSISARAILDRGSERIRRDLSDQPETMARLMATMGNVYQNLGLYEEAEDLLTEAIEIQRRVLGLEDTETLATASDLANLYFYTGRYGEAESLQVETLEKRRALAGAGHTTTLQSMMNLATIYKNQGRFDEAESLYVAALEAQRRVLGREHIETLKTLNNLGNLHFSRGRYEDAMVVHTEALEIAQRTLGEEHPLTLMVKHNLGGNYYHLGRMARAESLFRECVDVKQKVLGPEHLSTLQSMTNLAAAYTEQGRYDLALPLQRETVDIMFRTLGAEHMETLGATNNLADVYYRQGQYSAAESLFAANLDAQTRVLGMEHPDVLLSLYNLAALAAVTGRKAESLARLRTAMDRGFAEEWMLEDSEFDALRGDPEFDELVAEIQEARREQGR